MPDISPVYHPRKPKDSQYYRCVKDHLDKFEQIYDEWFTTKCGSLCLRSKPTCSMEGGDIYPFSPQNTASQQFSDLLPLTFTGDHTNPEALAHGNPPVLNMLCKVWP
jgi:hypothetical protein